ncbi:MAG: guanylate kinase [Lentisphaerales bacterium]|nr:MAG: guanylate kinase [Lentisphaerales bacterium]
MLIVISAPSAAGKTTLCDRLLAEHVGMVYSVSCTTRPPRGREVGGVDYVFLDADEFEQKLERAEFLEHAEVFGHMYGTLRGAVEEALRKGKDLLMDIDVQGADQVRSFVAGLPDGSALRKAYIDVFIEPPSLAVLETRLRLRNEDSQESICERMKNAEHEMNRAGSYMYRIVNDDLETAYAELKSIVQKEHARI